MKAIISEKGQVTIPQPLRRQLGLKPGHVLEFEVKKGRLIGRKRITYEGIEDVVGLLSEKIDDVDEYLNETRGMGHKDRKSS